MKSKRAYYEIFFYILLPLGILYLGKGKFDEYVLIVLSTLPGFLYALVTFIWLRSYNFTGLFNLTTLLLNTGIGIAAGSVKWMFISLSIYDFLIALGILGSSLIRKPIALFFALDLAVLQGYDRQKSKELYTRPGIFKYLYILTALFFVLNLIYSLSNGFIAAFCYDEHLGQLTVSYEQIFLYKQTVKWTMAGCMLLVWIFFRKSLSKPTTAVHE